MTWPADCAPQGSFAFPGRSYGRMILRTSERELIARTAAARQNCKEGLSGTAQAESFGALHQIRIQVMPNYWRRVMATWQAFPPIER